MSGSITTGQFALANIFAGDAFSAVTLSAQINTVPFAPQLLGSMGLFLSDGVPTTTVAIAERSGQLSVVPTSERGAPPTRTTHAKRTMRDARCTHLALEDRIYADEVQNAVAQGLLTGQPQLETAAGLVEDRMSGPFGLRARIELTLERHRLGAIQGKVLDADGSLLHDWYSFFDLAPLPDAVVGFGGFTAEGGDFEKLCTQLTRDAIGELEGLPVTGMNLVAFCGDNWYDQAYSNKEVKAARRTRDTGRNGDVFDGTKAFSTFTYGGITFVNYRGTRDGSVGIGIDEARLFPAGVPGLFQQLFGPPDLMGMTNMKGLPVYGAMPPESQTSRAAVIEAQSNPLTFCAKPRALRRLTKS